MSIPNNLDGYRRYLREELTPCPKERGKYQCPICGSGSGQYGDGAFSIDHDEVHGKCFSCGWYGDIFDLFAQRDLLSLQDATRAVMAKYGKPSGDAPYTQAVSVQKEQPAPAPDQSYRKQILREVADFHAAIMGSAGQAYLNGRGISDQSIQRFRLGFDQATGRISIPHDKAGSYYTTRLISGDSGRPAHYNLTGVEMPIFNADALYQDAPCFIVESTLCAISIEQEGGKAVALCGTQGLGRLMKQIKLQRPSCPMLILAMDNDAPGQDAALKIREALEKEGLSVLQANVAGDCKDPNELLQRSPAALRGNVADILQRAAGMIEAAEEARKKAEEQERNEYLGACAAGDIEAFLNGVNASATTPAIPTGFTGLDLKLDGGLYEGLYIIGAISSLGKTTFVQQIGDQLARDGHDVLYFSLEMSRFELMAKSISRLTYSISKSKGQAAKLAKTTRGILAGAKYPSYSRDEMAVIGEAVSQYEREHSPHIWIREGIGDIGVEQIREAVEKHIRLTGRTPVVIIDYLQILAPADIKASDKQNTDKAVLELKRLSRDKKLPVLAISSLNRENYNAPISMTAFKESGAIEYSSDVLLGLQYKGMDYQEGEADKAREKRIRDLRKRNDEKAAKGEGIEIELKILKNRNGNKGTCDPFLFIPRFNTYIESTLGFFADDDTDTPFDKGKVKTKL